MSAKLNPEIGPLDASVFPAAALREQFPALQRAGSFVFFDNAAGAQVPQIVLDAVNKHLIERNVQRGGRYPQSMAVDASVAHARAQRRGAAECEESATRSRSA